MKPNPSRFRPVAASRRGFTLIEILVVIVIIVIIAALLIPVGRSLRTSAMVTKCTNNLRVWSVVIQAYAADHNQMIRYRDWEDIGSTTKFYNPYFASEETFWPEKGRAGTTQGYHRMCPAQKWNGDGNPPRGYLFVRPNQLGSSGNYVRNEVDTDNDGVPDSFSMAKMTRPSQLLVMMDAADYKNIYRTSEFELYVKPVCINTDKTMIRHGGGVNALFGDWHIDFLKWNEIDPAIPANTARVTTWLNLD